MSPRWIVCQTKPRQENWAKKNVEAQGCETYLPIARPDLERKIYTPQPLFRSYLFVLIIDKWYFLKSTFGVTRPVLTADGNPAIVPDGVITELRRRQGRDGLIAIPKHRFEVGQQVRVKDGPFQYQLGLFQGQTNKQRVKVLFGLIKAEIDDKLLEAA